MEKVNAFLLPIVQKINAYLADYVLIFLLVGIGLWFTFKTGCVQRYLGHGLKSIFGNMKLKGEKTRSGMSSFQAVATAIAAARASLHSFPCSFLCGVVRPWGTWLVL